MAYQTADVNKYFNNDTIFNAINKNFISLHENDVLDNNIHLQRVINNLIQRMKDQDAFFQQVYQRIVYSGSFYKQTKFGYPDEFDLNIVIKLPLNYDLIKVEPCYPGFVKIYSGVMLNINNLPKTLRNLLDYNMYLDQEIFRRWMESVFSRAISKLPEIGEKRLLKIGTNEYMIRVTKSGPAFTLYLDIYHNKIISLDLVPVLELIHKIPDIKFDLTCFKKLTWYAVPKPLDNFEFSGNKRLYWRTCFYEQEKEILSKNGKIKPVLRQMKKFRDTQKWKHIASYYIETLLLNVLNKYRNLERQSCTSLFMMMLQELYQVLEDGYLPYYWNQNFNLIDRLTFQEIDNIRRRLRRIINCIHENIQTDPYIIASYVLNEEELLILKFEKESLTLKSEEELLTLKSKEESSNAWKCIIL